MERTTGRDSNFRLALETLNDPNPKRFERPKDFTKVNSKYPKLISPVNMKRTLARSEQEVKTIEKFNARIPRHTYQGDIINLTNKVFDKKS